MAKRRKNSTAKKVKPEGVILFAARLKELRLLMPGKPNQEQFAKYLGMDEAETYRRWERAETEPDISRLQHIVDKTGVSLDWLLAVEHKVVVHKPIPQLRIISNTPAD